MARITPIAEVLELEEGMSPQTVSGTITSIYEQSSGSNSLGPWSIQNVFLEDKGAKIKLKVCDIAPIPLSMRGKTMVIELTNAHGKGWTGMKVKWDKPPKGQAQGVKILSVTKSAALTINGMAFDSEQGFAGQQPAEQDRPPVGSPAEQEPRRRAAEPGDSQQQEPARQPQQTTKAPAKPQEQEQQPAEPASHAGNSQDGQALAEQEAIKRAKQQIGKMRNLYAICLRASASVHGEFAEQFGTPKDIAAINATATTFFIQSLPGRRDLDLLVGMPFRDISDILNPKK